MVETILYKVMKCIKSLDLILSVLLIAILFQGGLASPNDNSTLHRSHFFVFKNTQNELLATYDQIQFREKCQDKHPSCPAWGSRGECHHNPNYMVPNCAYTCNTCLIEDTQNELLARYDQTQSREKCQDKHPSCPTWGHQGECHHSPNYMVLNCAYTCNTCLIDVSNNIGVQGQNDVQDNNGVQSNNGVQGQNVIQGQNVVQGNIGIQGCVTQKECDIRENITEARTGIMNEASLVGTTTVENVTMATNEALTDVLKKEDAQSVGEEILTIVAESVASSAREYAMGCRDLSPMCQNLTIQGNCTSNPSFMLVNCPISCNSCLPINSSECINKGSNDSCDLSAVLGLCEVNYAYNLRFCSGSCKNTQSLMDKCIPRRKDFSSCPERKTLTDPDFECGAPLNRRRKRLAVSIFPVQSPNMKDRKKDIKKKSKRKQNQNRLKEPNMKNGKKNIKKKRKRKQNQNRNISEEKIKNTDISGKPNMKNRKKNIKKKRKRKQNQNGNISEEKIKNTDISGKQSEIDLNANAEDASARQGGAVCCSVILASIPQSRQMDCTIGCDVVCSNDFNCECCDDPITPTPPTPPTPTPTPTQRTITTPIGELVAPWISILAPLILYNFVPPIAPPAAPPVAPPAAPAAPAAPPQAPPAQVAPQPAPAPAVPAVVPAVVTAVALIAPIIAVAPIVPLIILSVVAAVPPLLAITSQPRIDLTNVETRRAARSLLPFCDPNGYLDLRKQLAELISSNTGLELDPRVRNITRAITYCQHGAGQNPPPLAAPIAISTGFGNFSNIDAIPPPSYPGVSYPGFGEDLAGIDSEAISDLLDDAVDTIDDAADTLINTTDTVVNTTDIVGDAADTVVNATDTVGDAADMVVYATDTIVNATDTVGDVADTVDDAADTVDDAADTVDDAADTVDDAPESTEEEAFSGIATIGSDGTTSGNDRDRFFCGASLIHRRFILTAAHCLVYDFQKPERIRLGERDFQSQTESRTHDYVVKRIILHPEYKILSGYNDIAVIELTEDVTVMRSGNLLPYCLPSEPINLDGRTCTFSGWGSRPNQAASQILVNVNVTVVALDECRDLYNRNEIFQLTHPRGLNETSLCAAGEEGMDSCRGDSGGPLVLRSDGEEDEIGIVSQGIGCGDPRYPGIYTRTDAYLDWLDEVVYGEENEKNCP